MNINFKEIKLQGATNETLLLLIESLYNQINESVNTNIILNEKIIGLSQDTKNSFEFSFELLKIPTSSVEIFITDDSGDIVITPNSIVGLNGNKVTITSTKINKNTNLYVTYKF